MAHHWHAVHQLQGFLGTWYFFERGSRIAIIETVEVSSRRLLRAQTWHDDPEMRALLGYFPERELSLAADVIWSEWTTAQRR